MKKIIFALSLAGLLTIGGFAQKQKNQPQEVDGAKNSQTKSTKQNNGGKVMLESGASIEGELQKTLDVKNTNVGDEVVLRVTKSIKQNGEIVVPKGTRLIGKVTEIQERTKTEATSKIGVVFEQIQGKNLNAPINASIVSITQAAADANLNDGMPDTGVSSSSSSSANASGRSSGGLLGGVGTTVGGVVNTTTNTVGGVTNTAGETVGGAASKLGSAVNGIRLSQSANASAQGATTLSAQGKNVRLEKGVVFGIRLNESVEYNNR